MQYRIFRACSDARNACFGGPQKGFDGIRSTAVIRWKDRLDLLSGQIGPLLILEQAAERHQPKYSAWEHY